MRYQRTKKLILLLAQAAQFFWKCAVRYQPAEFFVHRTLLLLIFRCFGRGGSILRPCDGTAKARGSKMWRQRNALGKNADASVKIVQHIVKRNDALIGEVRRKALEIDACSFV